MSSKSKIHMRQLLTCWSLGIVRLSSNTGKKCFWATCNSSWNFTQQDRRDAYNASSFKAHTRETRGNGVRRRVEPNSPIPTNWDGFLRVDENKKELLRFLAGTCSTTDCFDKKVISSYDQSVLGSKSGDIGDLWPCTHEEADKRIFVHCLDSVRESNKRLLIRTVDTDVAVIAIYVFRRLSASEIWIAFRSGKAFRYIEVYKIAAGLGPEKSLALPFFMLPLAVTKSCPFMLKATNLLGTHGTSMRMLLQRLLL